MINRIGMLVSLCIFLYGTVVFGQNNILNRQLDDFVQDGGGFVLNAGIMSVDVNHNMMIVAEKIIKLKVAVDEKGYRQYQTIFIDSSGKHISIGDFKPRMNVIVDGTELPNDTIIADRITLLLE